VRLGVRDGPGATPEARSKPEIRKPKWPARRVRERAAEPAQRCEACGARNASWSAPVLAGDRLYVPNQNADVFVLRASPTFECLATNSIGTEQMNASLAVSDRDVFLRTHQHLWCLSETGKVR